MSRRDDLVRRAYESGAHAARTGRGADYCTGETQIERIYWLLGRQDALIAQEDAAQDRGAEG